MPHEVGTLAVDETTVTFGAAMRGLSRTAARPGPSSLYHPSTASVPITVLLYNGPLFCGFNVPIKGLMESQLVNPFLTKPPMS